MARTGFFHHIGTFLLFAATVLLIITCISSPVVNEISILTIELGGNAAQDHSTVTFGTFGYCINNVNGRYVPSALFSTTNLGAENKIKRLT